MTPEELEKLPKPLERIMTSLELDIMSEIIERIKEAQQITPVTDWLLNRLSIIGASKARVKQILHAALEAADLQVDDIYDQAAKSDYIRTKAIYEAAGQDYTPYEDNQYLQQIVDAVRRQTKESLRAYENITQTTGFNVYMGGKRVFTPMSEYLERSLDKAMLGITTGMKTYSQAIGDVIDEMTSSGVRIVDYASGKSDRIEVAARRAVMTGVAQMTDKVNEKNAEELKTDYWEVDWHMGARNTGTGYMNHQSWQGKVYSSEEMRTVCGLGEMLGFAGINCYHIRWPFIPGVSKRKYTDEWLAEQNRKENEKKEFRGKEYDTYAALQYQRKLERVIRKQKQDIKLLEKGGADKDNLTAARCRKRLTEKTYTEFSAAMGLRQQRERLKVGEIRSQANVLGQKNRGKKVLITEQAIEKVREIVPSELTQSNGQIIKDTHQELLRYSMDQNDSNEVASVVDLIKNERSEFVKGDRHSVNIYSDPDVYHSLMTGAENSLVLCHNHPGLTDFSANDIGIFMRHNSIKAMTIVTNLGKASYISKTKDFDYRKAVALMKDSLEQSGMDAEKGVEKFLKRCYSVGIEKDD